MSLDVYAFAIAAALLWGFSHVPSKRGLSSGGNPLQISVVMAIIRGGIYWVALLLIAGAAAFSEVSLGTIAIFVASGVVGTTIGRLSIYTGEVKVGATVSTAVTHTRPLFASALAIAFLGETVTPLWGVGVIALIAGLAVISRSKGGNLRGWKQRDLIFPLLGAAAYGVGNVIRKFGLTTTSITTLEAVTINETAVIITLGGYLLARHGTEGLRFPRRAYGYFALTGVLGAGALFSLFEALDRGEVVIVDPLTATAPLFTIIFAYLLLGDLERVTKGLIAGVLLVVAGAVLIVLGG